MSQTHVGTSELKLGPRQDKMIQDAYQGMTLYAANSYDPSTVYAQFKVDALADAVHFTEHGGGYGKPPPPGPPERVAAPTRARRQPKKPQPEKKLPGIGADDAGHGVDLNVAISGCGDIRSKGASMEAPTQEKPADPEFITVPGLGKVRLDSLPPHVQEQMKARQAQMQEANVREGPDFPDYDEQQRAMACDGENALPPIVVHRPRRTGLTMPERWVASLMQMFCRCSAATSQTYARPVSLFMFGLGVYFGVVWYRRRKKVHSRGFH